MPTTRAVFDASALIRATVDGSVEASTSLARAESREFDVRVPDLIWVEVTYALRRHVRAERLSAEDAGEIQLRLLGLPLAAEPLRPLAPSAMQVALERGISVHDAFYVVLAEAAGATLVTADRRLAAVAANVALLT